MIEFDETKYYSLPLARQVIWYDKKIGGNPVHNWLESCKFGKNLKEKYKKDKYMRFISQNFPDLEFRYAIDKVLHLFCSKDFDKSQKMLPKVIRKFPQYFKVINPK